MKHYLTIVFYLSWVVTTLKAQVRTESVPPWVTVYEVNDKFQPKTDNISGGYYYILLASQNNTAEQTENIQRATRVFNAAGIEYMSDLVFTYDPGYEKVIFHRIAIIRNGQYLDQSDELKIAYSDYESSADIRIYDGRKTGTIHFKDVREGDILYYNYSSKGHNPVFNGHYADTYNLYTTDTIDHLVITLMCHSKDSLHYKLFNSTLQPQITENNQLKIFSWELRNTHPLKQESYPSWYVSTPQVAFSDFNSWNEVRAWARPLFTNNETASKELMEWVRNTKDHYPDINDQVTRAIRWVQNEVRYLGLEFNINSHKPANPNATFHNRYGDCKDKSFLLSTMLQMLGVESYPVLVNTYSKYFTHEKLPSAHAFNHCIVSIQLKGFTFHVDPTINFQGGRAPNIYFPDYTLGLSLHTSSRDLDSLHTTSISSIKLHEIYKVPAKTGGGTLQVITVYKGGSADTRRSGFQYRSRTEAVESYIDYYEKLYDGIKSTADLRIDDDTIENILTVEENYSIEKLWLPLDSTVSLAATNINFNGSLVQEYLPYVPEDDYDGPIEMTHPIDLEHSITVYLPEKWNFDINGVTLSNDMMDFSSDFTLEKDSIVECIYKLKSTAPYIMKKEAKKYKSFKAQIDNEIGFHVTQNPTTGKYLATFMIVFFSILCLIGFAVFCYFLYRWNPTAKVREATYVSIGGWLILPAIGIFFTPVKMIFELYKSEIFEPGYWESLHVMNTTQSHFWLVLLVAGQLSVNLWIICFSILLIFLFLNRRTSVPVLMPFLYVSFILSAILYIASASFIDTDLVDTSKMENEGLGDLVKSIIVAMIWIPYFLKSERVAGTFVKRLKSIFPPEIPVIPVIAPNPTEKDAPESEQ